MKKRGNSQWSDVDRIDNRQRWVESLNGRTTKILWQKERFPDLLIPGAWAPWPKADLSPLQKGQPPDLTTIPPWPLSLVTTLHQPLFQRACSLTQDLLPWPLSDLHAHPPTGHLPWWPHSHLSDNVSFIYYIPSCNLHCVPGASCARLRGDNRQQADIVLPLLGRQR